MNSYKSRWHQIQAFRRRFSSGKMTLSELIRSVALAAACHEREESFKRIDEHAKSQIASRSVQDLLPNPRMRSRNHD